MESQINDENIETQSMPSTPKKRGRKRKEEMELVENVSSYNELLTPIMVKVNDGIKSKKISKDVVLSYALAKIKDSDISKIRKDYTSNEDKVLMMYEEYKKKSGNDEIGFYDFLALQMKIPN